MRASGALLALGLIFLLLHGCINNAASVGLTTKADCDSRQPPLRDSEKIPCYHQAAISQAYLENNGDAVATCSDIVNNIGSSHPNDDIGAKAQTEKNLCYFDIAKIIARQDNMEQYAVNVCSNIQDATGHSLTGSVASQETCISEAHRLAAVKPQNYYGNPNNVCSLVLVLPLLLGLALFESRRTAC